MHCPALALLVLDVALSLVACSNDLDALYRRPLPPLPFVPDAERIDKCRACAEANCTPERDACIADAACTALLQCRGICSDPDCLARCGEKTYADRDRFARPDNEIFAAYETCLSERECRSECGWSKNWDCVNGYDWSVEQPTHVPLELELHPFGAVMEAQVSACSECSADECDVIDRTQTDAWGQAVIDVGGVGSTGCSMSFLEMDFGEAQTATLYAGGPQPSSPFQREARWAFDFGQPNQFSGDPRFGDTADPTFTFVLLGAVDCLGVAALGVSFEIEGDYPSAVRFYFTGTVPSADATETTDADIPIGGFVGRPAGDFSVRAKFAGKRVGSRDGVRVREGGQTVVIMFPDTTGGT